MSEFTNKAEKRIATLTAYTLGLINNDKGVDLLQEFQVDKIQCTPSDILEMFDRVFKTDPDMEALKTASNKLFNILYKTLSAYPAIKPETNNFIACLIENNKGAVEFLNNTKPLIKQVNKETTPELINALKLRFVEFQKFISHYVVKENILFPYIESNWSQHACLKLMWSLHDDVRRNIKATLEILNSAPFNREAFNRVSSKVYFSMNTIKFREEKVLFPVLLEKIDTSILDDMKHQAQEIGLAFVDLGSQKEGSAAVNKDDNFIQFKTGKLSLEQLELVFKHLPVDITFVDENDTVQYFSDPVHRIFPRSTGIIGRKVQNCHPHESVDVVNQIVDAFKKGEKNVASFWIHMGSKYVLIQYFAVRDENNHYKGVLEVSQEISEIQEIKGDKRLLDWKA